MSKKTVWLIVLLVGAYVICQAVADVGATAFVQVGSISMPVGTFVFALTFTLRDLLHKRLGKQWAQATIVACGLFNVFQAGYLALVALLPMPEFFGLGAAWRAIFAVVPAITVGSICAEVVSQLVDTEIFHLCSIKGHWPQWAGVLLSNAVSLPLDSLIFGTLAFVVLPPVLGAAAMPFGVAMSLVVGQILWKGAVTLVSWPLVYLVKKKDEGIGEGSKDGDTAYCA